MAVSVIGKKNFDQIITDNDLVVIEFWADWCGPCKSFKPVFKSVAEATPDAFFGAVDVDEEKELANDFSIQSIPFIMILRRRVAIFSEPGVLPASALSELIAQAKKLDIDKIIKENG